MPIEPDTQDEIFTDIRDRLLASGAGISNFSPNSPERALADEGFAAEIAALNHATLAAQLSGWVEYAGGPIDEDDLSELGLDPLDAGGTVDLDLLNSLLRDSDLDAKAAQNGITRDPGAFATGDVEITTSTDSVVIPAGTLVSTGGADDRTFETVEEVSPASGSTTVTAPIEAVDRGTEFNVGSGTIIEFPSPPSGAVGVTNPAATTGGEDPETNAELRARTQQALIQNSGGGTVGGIEGGLISAFDGVDAGDVVVDEFPTQSPPRADVIVDGGPPDSEVQAEIDRLRPTAIEHTLVRPTQIVIDITADVSGAGIDASAVETAVTDLLRALNIGEDLIRDQLIAAIINADAGINGIASLTVSDSGGSIPDDRTIGAREKAVPGAVSVTVV